MNYDKSKLILKPNEFIYFLTNIVFGKPKSMLGVGFGWKAENFFLNWCLHFRD